MTSTSRRTLSEADVVDLAAPVAHSQLEPRMRAALVCSVERFLASVAIQARYDNMAVDNEAVGLSRVHSVTVLSEKG